MLSDQVVLKKNKKIPFNCHISSTEFDYLVVGVVYCLWGFVENDKLHRQLLRAFFFKGAVDKQQLS